MNNLIEKIKDLTSGERLIVKPENNCTSTFKEIRYHFLKLISIENLVNKTLIGNENINNIEAMKYLLEEYSKSYINRLEVERNILNDLVGEEAYNYIITYNIGYSININAEFVELYLLPCSKKPDLKTN